MMHIYAQPDTKLAEQRRREIRVENIKFLHKIEDRTGTSSLISERVADEMSILHSLWFKKAKENSVNTSKQ